MGMADGIDILVADDPESFANKLIEVYTSESLWNKVSQGSLEFADRNYSYSMGVSRLRNLLASVGK
jgi:glycosyltransferase involved in cell wall biosynthesis